MACDVWFYHLEATVLDQALPELLEKTQAKGWRPLVCSPDRARIEHLDTWLWTYREDSFLPHGLAQEDEAMRQPILLTHAPDERHSAHAVFLLDDAEPGRLEDVERCIVMFDGRDEAALAAARKRWRELKAAGHPASYWRQSSSGRWDRQA